MKCFGHFRLLRCFWSFSYPHFILHIAHKSGAWRFLSSREAGFEVCEVRREPRSRLWVKLWKPERILRKKRGFIVLTFSSHVGCPLDFYFLGTGASCIYPLLGATLNGWYFLATEVDDMCFNYAKKNVEQNNLSDLIKGWLLYINSPLSCVC